MIRSVFPLLIFVGLAVFVDRTATPADLVGHRTLPVEHVSRSFARLVFTMRLLRWPDGTRVRVCVLPDDHPTHSEFSKQVLALYPRQLRRAWDRHLFSGVGAVPVQVQSVEEMIEFIRNTPGAVGYLPAGAATSDVKVVPVE